MDSIYATGTWANKPKLLAESMCSVYLDSLSLGREQVPAVYKVYKADTDSMGHGTREETRREEAAHYLAKLTGLVRVPDGALRHPPAMHGYGTVWAQEYIPGRTADSVPRATYQRMLPQLLDMLLFDVAIGNEDRHERNWLVLPGGKVGKPPVAVAIDHGCAFGRWIGDSWHVTGDDTEGISNFLGYGQCLALAEAHGMSGMDPDRPAWLPLSPTHLAALALFLGDEVEQKLYGLSLPQEAIVGMRGRVSQLLTWQKVPLFHDYGRGYAEMGA